MSSATSLTAQGPIDEHEGLEIHGEGSISETLGEKDMLPVVGIRVVERVSSTTAEFSMHGGEKYAR